MIDLMSYNFEVKFAGKHLTLKKYERKNQFNYTVEKPNSGVKGKSDYLRENFIRSISRARKNVFDIIACNVNAVLDYEGNLQRPKFLTLTFKENIQDLKEANAEFTKFNKRLSYQLYGENKNVLKYICIPEFQKRGAVHFHALYFNLPYIDFKNLGKIWGQGYVFIEGVESKEEIEDFAKYVSKYINKENSKGEDNYEIYKEKDLLNQKRYFCSRGLKRPSVFKLDIDKDLYESMINMLKDFHTSNYEYENEFIGRVEQNNYEVENKNVVENIKNLIATIFKKMFDLYNRPLNLHNEKRYLLNFIKGFGHLLDIDLAYIFS